MHATPSQIYSAMLLKATQACVFTTIGSRIPAGTQEVVVPRTHTVVVEEAHHKGIQVVAVHTPGVGCNAAAVGVHHTVVVGAHSHAVAGHMAHHSDLGVGEGDLHNIAVDGVEVPLGRRMNSWLGLEVH